ncbi:hypothetical protein [Paludibacterium paludis]|uniref:Uncharacterized protein n=1 Tax=Paludibacterium paludis TaxID=1225769 RepID=A0A918U9G8_9NEIS|nr:hypothetical protein [Paludibacterium paludis]GGY13477.1 hypothetical protein GCM10011289_15990 [Paludibacterium paludis]
MSDRFLDLAPPGLVWFAVGLPLSVLLLLCALMYFRGARERRWLAQGADPREAGRRATRETKAVGLVSVLSLALAILALLGRVLGAVPSP